MYSLKIPRVPVIVSVVLLVAVSLPYLVAAQAGGPGWVFGGFLLNPLDGNSYLAKMYEGWRGEWLFSLPYTAVKGNGSFLFIYYLFLGHAARWLGLSLVVTFHLARLAGAAVLLLALYRFFRTVLPEPRQANLAFTLAAVGSGLGWLALALGAFTSDFWVAEAFPFLSAYANPHFPLAMALLLWLLTPVQPGKIGFGKVRLFVFLASLSLAVISPFGVVIAAAVHGSLIVWELLSSLLNQNSYRAAGDFRNLKWVRSPSALIGLQMTSKSIFHPSSVIRRMEGSVLTRNESRRTTFLRLPWILLGGLPPLLYDLWISQADPYLASWNTQNLTASPPFWDLVVSLSPALILALPATWMAVKSGRKPERVLVAWLGLGLILLSLPFGLQRRFMLGLYIPAAGLAALGIDRLMQGEAAEGAQRKRYRWAVSLLFILALPTNLVVLLAAGPGAQNHDPNLYLTRGEAQSFRWIEANTPPEALFLSSPQTGLFLPAYSGRRVLYGHPFETANAEAEKEFVTDYYQKGWASNALLADRGVDYIYWGPREQSLNPANFLSGQPVVYDAGGVRIYSIAKFSAVDE